MSLRAPTPPPALTGSAPRLVGAERVAIALILTLLGGAFAARPLAERGDPALAVELHVLYDGPGPVRHDALWLIPRSTPITVGPGRWLPNAPDPADPASWRKAFKEPQDDPWGQPWGPAFVRLMDCFPTSQSFCSTGPDRTLGTTDDILVNVPYWPGLSSREAIVCARPALLALAAGVALLALLARALPRPATTGQDVGIALALAGAAIGALVPFTSGWVDALPGEVRDAVAARLLVDARHAIVGSVVVVTAVGALLLRLGRRAVDPPAPEPVVERKPDV